MTLPPLHAVSDPPPSCQHDRSRRHTMNQPGELQAVTIPFLSCAGFAVSPGSVHSCMNRSRRHKGRGAGGYRNKWPEEGRLSLPPSGMLKLLGKLQLLHSLRCWEQSEQGRVQPCLRVTESSPLALQLSPPLFLNRWS